MMQDIGSIDFSVFSEGLLEDERKNGSVVRLKPDATDDYAGQFNVASGFSRTTVDEPRAPSHD